MALETEIQAFEDQKSELETHHKGKWVLFVGAGLIGAFDTFENAAREAERKYGRGPYLIRQVGVPPPRLSTSVMYGPLGNHAAA
jgi:hypothetical protein